MKRKPNNAFTLLEMLAVITILGIMAVIVLPRISVQAFQSKGKVCSQYCADLNSAIEQYYLATGTFPASVNDLVPDYYPDVVPICPVTSNPYTIDPTSNRVLSHGH